MSRVVIGSVAAALALLAIACANYPGGSWFDAQTTGFDFARNFLCDLLEPVAHDGRANAVAMWSASAAMAALGVALGATWWTLASSRWLRALGAVNVAGLVAIPLASPINAYGLHAACVFASGVPGGLAVLVTSLSRRADRAFASVGVAAVAALAIDGGLYGYQLAVGGAPTLLLPLFERLAMLLLFVWLILAAGQLRATRR